MTLDEYKKKYTWAANMTTDNVKELLMFFMMTQLKTAMERNGKALEEFFDDSKGVFMKDG